MSKRKTRLAQEIRAQARNKTYPDKTGTGVGFPRLFLAGLPGSAGSVVRFEARGRGATLSFPCGRLGAAPCEDPAPPASPPPPPNAATPTTGVSVAYAAMRPNDSRKMKKRKI